MDDDNIVSRPTALDPYIEDANPGKINETDPSRPVVASLRCSVIFETNLILTNLILRRARNNRSRRSARERENRKLARAPGPGVGNRTHGGRGRETLHPS
jgi:hypothetical protein